MVQWPKPPLSVSPLGAKVQASEDFCHAEQQHCCKNICVLWSSELETEIHCCKQRFLDKRGQFLLNPGVSSVLGCLLPCQPHYCTLTAVVETIKMYAFLNRPEFRGINYSFSMHDGIKRVFRCNPKIYWTPSATWCPAAPWVWFFSLGFQGFLVSVLTCHVSYRFVLSCLFPSCFLLLCACWHPCNYTLAATLNGQDLTVYL